MNVHNLAAIALAVLLTTAGAAAAMPGNAPDSTQNDEDDHRVGPPGGLPGPVPDFVERLHALIESFLNGDLGGSLGEAISDVTPGNTNATEG